MTTATLPSPAEEVALRQLLARYCACADRVPDAQGWAKCFTSDAVVRIYPRGRHAPLVLSGLDTIATAFERIPALNRQVHVVTNTLITVDGARAHVESCFARLDIVDGAVDIGSFGRYIDVARRGRPGEWKLSARDIHLLARAPSR